MIRLLIILLNITTKALHGHLYHLIDNIKGDIFKDVKDVKSLVEQVKSVNASVHKELKRHCFYDIPNSVEEFDISKSVALIQDVFKEIFNYDRDKFVFCELLRDIRNNDYAHKKEFEMDDIDFSATVVKIEEKSLMSEVLVELKWELKLFNSKIDEVLEGLDEVKEMVKSQGDEIKSGKCS